VEFKRRCPGSAFKEPPNMFNDIAGRLQTASDWQVVFKGMVKVRAEKDLNSTILTTLAKCEMFSGIREGGWVKRVAAPGYVSIQWEDLVLIEETHVVYTQVFNRTCEEHNLWPIMQYGNCEVAAGILGLPDVTASPASATGRPLGCYFADMAGLFLSTSPIDAIPAGNGRSLICSSVKTCHPTTSTSSTATTSTTTTRTGTTSTVTTTVWGYPSMFCWAVVRPWGYEPGLVQAQYRRGASIFNCDTYAVLSSGEDVDLGPVKALFIPDTDPGADVGDLTHMGTTTNSWLNTWIFMQAWKVVHKETTAIQHDWTVKVDPDAVFFPERLRFHVADHTPAGGGASLYFMNCNREFGGQHTGAKLFGSLEVFSRKALKAYMTGAGKCEEELDWKGWGEDYFMSHCMDHLGVGRVEDFGMLSDKRCWWTECTDTWKVSFHDFKDEDSYFECWEKSLGDKGKTEYAAKAALRRMSQNSSELEL